MLRTRFYLTRSQLNLGVRRIWSDSDKMRLKSRIIMAGAAVTWLAGCFHWPHHGPRIGEEVSLPRGLDSAGTVSWVAQQRAACRGTLRVLTDHMPVVSLDGSPQYHSPIIGVQCVHP